MIGAERKRYLIVRILIIPLQTISFFYSSTLFWIFFRWDLKNNKNKTVKIPRISKPDTSVKINPQFAMTDPDDASLFVFNKEPNEKNGSFRRIKNSIDKYSPLKIFFKLSVNESQFAGNETSKYFKVRMICKMRTNWNRSLAPPFITNEKII